MNRLLIVSNRLPITVKKDTHGLHFESSVGGLATGLGSFYRKYNSIWAGWCGISPKELDSEDRKKIENKLLEDFDSYPILLTEEDIDNYYYGFCNKTIWPLFHCFTEYTVYDKELWSHYKRVNKIFCEAIKNIANPDDTIWVHDYHLMLLPKMLREELPNVSIGFFSHIPFPPFEIFHLLPWRDEIVEGLLGSELVGFHSYNYAHNFLDTVRHLKGHEHSLGKIITGERVVQVDAFPMGINYDKFVETSQKEEVVEEANSIKEEVDNRKIVVSIDRLDYTKGILQRLEAYNHFLKEYPEYRGEVTLILLAVPSRTRVEKYQYLKKELDKLISKINGEHGTMSWMPIWYLYRSLPFEKLNALYTASDVALVTPLKDGMNLISKEFLATKTDEKGVLILSEMAGASDELGEAITVNPNNQQEITEALDQALSMSEEEQKQRNKKMRARLETYNVVRWAKDFMDTLSETKEYQDRLQARNLSEDIKKELVQDYSESEKRLILLDYDGTLMPFVEKPREAEADEKIREILSSLTQNEKNELVIISGRDTEALSAWLGDLELSLVAEHGAWIREIDQDWQTIEPLSNEWKEKLRPILKMFVNRTPGSFLEEKEFSLVWHYRNVEPELASIRAGQLKDTLVRQTAYLDIGVMEGNKIIEIKNAGIDKSSATLKWLQKDDWGFIIGIGDDKTDEKIFQTLPDDAYSIKVGWGPSESRFNIGSVEEVRSLLSRLIEAG